MTPEAIEAALLEENRLRCNPPLDDAEVSRIAASIGRYEPADGLPSVSPKLIRPASALVFHSGVEIANAVPEEVPWVVRPYIAAGAITDLAGKVKLAGKTTVALAMGRSVIEGSEFLGWHTTQSPVVYLTEQPQVTFREAMKRAGLLAEENLYILFRNESFGIPWYEVAHAAVEKCKSVGAKLLVIDTLPQFAGLIGDSENNSGTALAAIEPLQVAASQGIGVLTISHNRKGGGGLGDSRRGSTAYAGAVDSLCVLQRTEGNGPRNQRLLSAVSRFEGTPEELLIELREDRFHSLGEPGEVAKEQTEQGVLAALPSSQSEALDIHALCKKTKMKRSPLQRVLNTLLGKSLAQTTGKGVRGKPVLYFKDSEE